jgi:hypothetical protein
MNFKTVALASYPRSGNTWLRHLLHDATGYGSRYIRNPETGPVHEAAAIPEIADEQSPLIKTHDCDAHQYEAAIHIVRHPCFAISSYLDYCHHFKVPIPRRHEFVEVEAHGWVKHTQHWRMAVSCGVLQAHYPIQYESLCRETYTALRRIVRIFLGIDASNEVIEEAVRANELAELQKRGKREFFPEGIARKPSGNLTDGELKIITDICSEEMALWGYKTFDLTHADS